jgi:Subtilase family/Peptidase inhibitor I9
MRKSVGFLPIGLCAAMAAACGGEHGSGTAQQSPAAPSAATSTLQQDMIVLLRDQMTAINPPRGARRIRASAIAAVQAPLLAQLQATQPRQIRSFELINGFATKLTQAEIDGLAARSEVLAVVPDRAIALPKRKAHAPVAGAAAGGTGGATTGSASAASLCNTLEPEALQLTKTAFLDSSTPQAQNVLDGSGVPVTGRGVTVAFIADGLDTTVPGFTRPDGSKVFVDYQNFTGDPAGTATAGGEAFGDASSIAAQDTPNGAVLDYDISQFANTAHPLPSPCNIRIRGMAPGASLVGLDIYSNLGYSSFASTWVQAIDWAVVHDDVDVINESFGSNLYPDNSTDPISLANAAAVRAGVTVVASTGDASANTLASPANDPWVIGAGATTQFRLYAQMSFGTPFATGYIDGNISGFSSGGFAQGRPGTVDIVAPGDLGWALCSTNQGLYNDCGDDNGKPTPIEVFGGTSEAAPLTAGAAALVIQAYRSTHHGATPSPALVKSILLGSASDLGAPSQEQGAGLLDALKAVNTALSIADGNGAPAPRGDGLVASPTSASLTANPGQGLEQTFQITNTGTSSVTLKPALEALGAPVASGSFNLTLTSDSPSFVDGYGSPNPYVTQTFTVPSGADHLDASIALLPVVSGVQSYGELYLIDPSGRLAAYSIPQGEGSGYGHADVVAPAAGKWTAVVATVIGYYSGPVQLSWSAERFASVGQVHPSQLTVPPGGTAFVSAALSAPAQAGDFAAALRLHGTGALALTELPFTVRTLIPIGSNGGSFAGTLTGGNGRQGADPAQAYSFQVPAGLNDMALTLQLADSGYSLAGYLIDPNGMILSSTSNVDTTGATQAALTLFRVQPQAGLWTFILQEVAASGKQTSIAFTAHIAFNESHVSAVGLPDGNHTALSAKKGAITVPVSVTNTGALSKAFFADARLSTIADVTLPGQPYSGSSPTLPGYLSVAYVPPHATAVQFVAQSSAPMALNAYPAWGDPILAGSPVGKGTLAASLSEPEVVFGPWYISPALIGPFGPSGAPTEAVTTTAVAAMQPFDATVSASSGDIWADLTLGTSTFQPLVLAPGATGTITLTITPSTTETGKTVNGVVYIDTFNEVDQYGVGDEVARLPYAYTVTP